jgi:ABC-2 type transport system permease protein
VVAQFLGLKLRLLGNLFRRSPWQVFGMVVGLLYGLGAAFAAIVGLVALRLVDVELARSGVVVAGSLVVLGFLLVPLVFGADDTIDPRKFSLFGIPTTRLAIGLAATAFVGVPALVIALIAGAQVVTWSRSAPAIGFALASAVLILVTCILGARVTTTTATLLLATRRAREATGLIALVVLSALSPLIAMMVTVDWEYRGFAVLHAIADVAQWTPLGAAWAAPAHAAAGELGAASGALAIAIGFVVVLALAWRWLVAALLVSPERMSRERAYTGLGWFARVPGTPAGVIAARSLSYWGRDVRYRAALVVVPIVPAVMVGALSIAGVPLHYLVLLPVPIMCFFLAWSTVHNDVAFDNTAVWLHVAADTDGRADRLGRIVPPLALGLIVILIGTPLSAWGFGSADVVPSVLGTSLCILLVGLGLSSVISAAFPYPAVHPGDSPLAQPQSSASGASWVQALSLLAVLVIAAPTVAFAVLGIAFGGGWHVAALILGIATGVAALWGGIRLGGRVFEARGPELLAFTARY